MLSLYELAQRVQEMPSSIALRESLWTYPVIETVHVLGLCLFVGTAWLWDLRLLGVTFGDVPVSRLSKQILPWTAVGFAIMALSGLGLVFSEPLRFYPNIFFRIKLVLLAAAGLNAFIFHKTVGRQKDEWDSCSLLPFRARLAGALSLGLWATVIVTGRLIAYNWFGAVRP
jgi:uncharacterized protein DUF6644